MKITAFNGSPRGESGNTNVMVTAFLKGAQDAGAEIENIFLANKEINHCKACGHCKVSKGQCVIKDDMGDLITKYLDSDIVVFATPLHIDNVSGMTKVFMDRTFCIGNPFFEKDETGEYRGSKSQFFKNGTPPKIVVISSSGYPQRSNFQVVSLLMKRLSRNFQMKLIAEIYATEGTLLTAPIKELEPIINQYKKALHNAGQEIAMNLKITEETQKLLEKSFIPEDVYIQKCNVLAKSILTSSETKA